MSSVYERDYLTPAAVGRRRERSGRRPSSTRTSPALQDEMRAAANLDFEKAAALRDDIKRLRNPELGCRGRRGGPDRRVLSFIESWLKKAALEVQEYVRLLVRGDARGLVTPPPSTATTSSSSSTRSASGR